MLIVKELCKTYNNKKILCDINFSIASGKSLAILGPSGSGKTTLLRLLMGFDCPNNGHITYNNVLFSSSNKIIIPPEKRRLGMVFQDSILFPHLTVLNNVIFAMQNIPKKDMSQKAQFLLEQFEVFHLKNRKIENLSGGERQRVAIARSLAAQPSLLILDEPFSNTDRLVRHNLLNNLKNYLQTNKLSSIIVTHDARDALDMASSVLILSEGRLEQYGDILEVFSKPANQFVQHFLEAGIGSNYLHQLQKAS